MTSLPTNIISDHALEDGHLLGYDATGALIVSMRYTPTVERFTGTEDDERAVTEWHMSPGGVRRMGAVAAWNSASHPTGGNA